MSAETNPPVSLPDPLVIAETLREITDTSNRLMNSLLQRRLDGQAVAYSDELGIGQAFLEMSGKLMLDPFRLAENHLSLWRDALELWTSTCTGALGLRSVPVIAPSQGDRRFKDEAWNEHVLFDFIKQSYLLGARWLQQTVAGVDGLDERTARKVEFYTRQFIDALAPTNFALTNPEALREIYRTGGESLLKGLRNLLVDLERGGGGRLAIRMTDPDAFELGVNVAVTPGKVVFQNAMMQLIQYAPHGKTAWRRPLLIVPPWINKFYILDLRERNSFIRWAVQQGHTVFVISWVNPSAEYAQRGFDDYLAEGTLAALDAIELATGERRVNAVGYCLGGTLLAATLGWLGAAGDERIASATFFTTMIDFSEPGELEVFLDDVQLSSIEKRMERAGYLDGAEMATTFNMLRANDLIWSFAVNNYLLGKDPFPFDLLYWNSDSTRMPAKMHSFYLRNMYQKNLLREPGGLNIAGRPIDLGRVTVPVYFLSTIEDHIAPWKSTYLGAPLFGGPVKFVLGGSGHIAGVINPPVARKYGYWTNPVLPADSGAWLADAVQTPGSWWDDWSQWVEAHDAERVPAREPGDGALPALEDAPGSYVKRRIT
ncbi:polyhydroxyalkanoate synthase [Plasticicumulans lactativorans]|uniref:Polyhydroxyalkanoate synthase n=1 Tax=Plasticicumulans lactativorans TaxID=1133106 RepID=A0A4R2L2X7_9GAMM|nr:class I poly(R)-hydroxyalkanoic acid synthase [Plasticicumulans lactativorans]TCO80844.1 polyhydroxyalkanoate synthase [Plasticicumulans lactativorans]